MEATGSDFTDTFRTLGKVSTSEDNSKHILDKLVQICAPVKLLDKKSESRYSPAELAKLEMILKQQPQMLRMFGMDPDEVRKEVEKANQKQPDSESPKEKQDELNKKNLELWAKWLTEYKQVLHNPDISDEILDEIRHESMNSRANPDFILRNYLMEEAI